MSNEPGLTLGRLVAAERNALAAVQECKRLSARVSSLEGELNKARAENSNLALQLGALNARTASLIGSGATQV